MLLLHLFFAIASSHAETMVELKRGELPLPSLDLFALPVRMSEDGRSALFSGTVVRKSPETLILLEQEGKPVLRLKDKSAFTERTPFEISFPVPEALGEPTRFRFREIDESGMEQSEVLELHWSTKNEAPRAKPAAVIPPPPPRPKAPPPAPRPSVKPKPALPKPRPVVKPKAAPPPKPAAPAFNEDEPPPDLE